MEKLNITQWAEEDRPREKLMRLGAEALTNAELLAILIGSGSPEDPAELARLPYTPSSALGSCRYKIADPDVDDTDYKRQLLLGVRNRRQVLLLLRLKKFVD